ncbi:electron transport complex subunit RsxC [Candidatus Endobugula sertula]|uniref:Ion-translocating oxidoreductase complex subunit C n=1 Tax=Candidatus Endobugula sertula TaxID=62101 RepID=A0A1D2QPC4_9GAMM|nr:electron transport complex subunit RsxC [Candidatus Endobugula sertula]
MIAKASGEFHGGIYPPENKQQSMTLPVGSLPIPDELIFPLNQHMGAPAEPIVSVGDNVLGGQKIAEAVGMFSATIHASSSGTVSAIEERILPHPSGMSGLCIVIQTDGKHQHIDFQTCDDYLEQEPTELIEKIREAGVTGLGGAGFPTAVKLKPPANDIINTLILNGTECEPYITADHSLMLYHAEEVIASAKLLSHILGNPEHVLIGVEDNKSDAIQALASALKNSAMNNIQIMTFPTKYPSGGEKQLIQLLTGKEVPSGAIPASLGIVMQNVGTAVAAYRAVALGQPLTSRITTLVGEALTTQRNYQVLLGTPIEFALQQAGFDASNNERLIMGGPMMGFTLKELTTPIIKSTNCIIAPSKKELPSPPPAQECIRCGLCSEVCPVSLLPQQLYWYAKAEDYERAQNYNLFDCIECGACSYVCSSNIPLVQYYRATKGSIRQQEQEKIKSDHARQRFEFRQRRFAKAEAEKIAKREARKKAAAKAKQLQAEKLARNPEANKDSTPKCDPVTEAIARVKAKENDPAAQQARLERSINSAKNRMTKLQEKLANAEHDKKNPISAQIKQVEVRLQNAEKQLAEFTSSEVVDDKPTIQDAASSAIEKAKANTAALANMSEKEKLEKQLTSLKQRLKKAHQRLADAEQENNEHLDAFKNSVTKLEQKLKDTQTQLSASTKADKYGLN